ncbi:hypothetical protein KBTX_03031 [wastewater metagenome]|uniref:DUF2835 domain-containing protein n=2 Tax=unclassified sequences TaxID=12908 RepID=A0A5B8RDM2_9ZZZZ|nr:MULTISPECIES: DUF2835 domain-containing protein [Arhodomonas]MCS4502996.1 DUF2835 domain-containing protein [Arhodomonas aquaeolei]QEA06691.1 hypothetical protein KBTEX_03031 [uncultured organism]
MPVLTLRLAISRSEWLSYYRGDARDVVARAEDGRRVRFPASVLHRHATHDGIHGRFELAYGDDGRFVALRRLTPG